MQLNAADQKKSPQQNTFANLKLVSQVQLPSFCDLLYKEISHWEVASTKIGNQVPADSVLFRRGMETFHRKRLNKGDLVFYPTEKMVMAAVSD